MASLKRSKRKKKFISLFLKQTDVNRNFNTFLRAKCVIFLKKVACKRYSNTPTFNWMKITFIFFCTSHVARSFETMILAFLDHKLVTPPKQQNHRIQGCSYVLYSGLSSSYQNGRSVDWGELGHENLLVWKMQTGSKNYNSPEFCDFAT